MPEDVSPDTRSDAELDSLADGTEIATNSGGPSMKEAPADAKGAAPGVWHEDEIEYGGKKIKAAREQILKWAQMGYDRPQVMAKFNQERQTWEKTVQEKQAEFQKYEQKFQPYLEIDKYAATNPEWWSHVIQSWQTRGQQPGAAAPAGGGDPRYESLAQRLQNFEQILPKVEKLAEDWSTERQSAKQREEDQALDTEIQSIRKSHADLDWDSPDENGKSLEHRICEHAGKIGTSSFRAAMRDLLHDALVSRAESNGKIAVSKGIQKNSKLGVLGTSPTPQSRNPRQSKNIRDTSYEELENEIREEIRSGRASA
jgi:hypothetical protein